VLFNKPVAQEPLVPVTELHPAEPFDIVQLVALVEDQVIIEVPPAVTVVGVADIVTVGAGLCGTFTTTVFTVWEPPVLIQSNLNL
jgi:hypothetical protein